MLLSMRFSNLTQVTFLQNRNLNPGLHKVYRKTTLILIYNPYAFQKKFKMKFSTSINLSNTEPFYYHWMITFFAEPLARYSNIFNFLFNHYESNKYRTLLRTSVIRALISQEFNLYTCKSFKHSTSLLWKWWWY